MAWLRPPRHQGMSAYGSNADGLAAGELRPLIVKSGRPEGTPATFAQALIQGLFCRSQEERRTHSNCPEMTVDLVWIGLRA